MVTPATDPLAVQQLAVAKDQAAAAWASVRAARLSVCVGVWAAGTTLLAVAAAFVVQRLQARSDKRLQDTNRRQLVATAAEAALSAADRLAGLHNDLETKLLVLNPDKEAADFRALHGVIDHYLQRDIPSLAIVGALVRLRPLAAKADAWLTEWNDTIADGSNYDAVELRRWAEAVMFEVSAARTLVHEQAARDGISLLR